MQTCYHSPSPCVTTVADSAIYPRSLNLNRHSSTLLHSRSHKLLSHTRHMGWIHIPLGRRTILVWFWFLVPCLYVEVMATKEWRKNVVENPGRHWEFSRRWPHITIRNISAEEMYPQVTCHITILDSRRHSNLSQDILQLERKLYWEGFPGYGWIDVLKRLLILRLKSRLSNRQDSRRIVLLSHLNGTKDSIEKLQEMYLSSEC